MGMGQAVYEQEAAARVIFEQADAVLSFSLTQLCFAGPKEALTDTYHQQLAVFVTSVATWQAMVAQGWKVPDYVAGHSLGEFAALVVAGSLTFEDGLMLVQRRGQLMKQAGARQAGGMAAIFGLSYAEVALLCTQAAATTGRPIQVANDNCPGQVVISGDRVALTEAIRLAKVAEAHVELLPVSVAPHSPLMASVSQAFAEAVMATPLQTPQVPIVGNTQARPLQTAADIAEELKAQLTASVRWTDSMRYLLSQGVTTFVEVGPGKVLSSLLKRIDRKVKRIKFEPASS